MPEHGYSLLHFETPKWGPIDLFRILPAGGDIWGKFAPLRETHWAIPIDTIPGEALSHALHGYHPPLMQVLGRHPHEDARRIPDSKSMCTYWEGRACPLAGPHCRPGADVPECYSPPDVDPDLYSLVLLLVQSWKEGRYTVVVEGEEFSY